MGSNAAKGEGGGLPQLRSMLDDAVRSGDRHFARDVFNRIAVSLRDVEEFVRFDQALYARSLICADDYYALYVMTWLPGQWTPIHDHRGSGCAVRVLRGIASEIGYERAACGSIVPVSVNKMKEGDVLYSFDSDIHQIGNLEEQAVLVTLHCYSPPLKNVHWFSLGETIFANHEALLESARARLE